jgi:hypothetical protein
MAITGQGIFSFGNNTKLGSSTKAYLQREAPRRDTHVYVIKTSAAQDKAALDYLHANSGKLKGVIRDNCVTRTNGALDAAGIPSLSNPPGDPAAHEVPSDVPGSAGMRAEMAGANVISIPKGSKTIPSSLNQFEPSMNGSGGNAAFGSPGQGGVPDVGTANGTYYFADGTSMTVTLPGSDDGNDDDSGSSVSTNDGGGQADRHRSPYPK